MENVVLIVHLMLALSLIGVVLLQRSEGGGLGIGGGGGAMTGRSPATALGKVTWGLAIAFIATSITLTIIAAEQAAGVSVVDRITDAPAPSGPVLPDLGGDGLLPPPAGGTGPALPQLD
ncbi:MAG: preprotein translocase subunit SecG [Rubellimicrobium sp.]|nr:preprotein translocase subunit SecG [Rubellimicrobium sp.]